jgi:hypothetical protein
MRKADPVAVLRARAEARALLFAACELADLSEALAPLYAYARRSGIFEQLGEEATAALIEGPFRHVCLTAMGGRDG